MLVIFDCDGVLVDSENLAAEVFSGCLKCNGIEMSPQQCFAQFKGHTLDYCRDWLEKHYPNIPDNFLQLLAAETQKAFASSLRAVTGVEDVLLDLRERNIPFCVASNGGHAKIEHSLRVTGLLNYFTDARFSRDDVPQGKPAPDLFLHAAEVMGVPPKFTAVVEDSETGVLAAQAAGMRVLLYAHHESRQNESAGLTRFSAMRDLPALLA